MKKNKNKYEIKEPKEVKDMVIVEGTVTEAFANAMFDVELDNGNIIKCQISGKIRMNKIRINPGDRVQVGISIYNIEQGRILYRLKETKP